MREKAEGCPEVVGDRIARSFFKLLKNDSATALSQPDDADVSRLVGDTLSSA